ncbi:MAG: DEAD/DEAH box helicase [Candidatus Hodarchaeales archaeon]|jgi:ATP-dependent Lhr-like helicase
MSFEFLEDRLQNILQDLEITPTPGQLDYLKAILANEDILVVASTGSGKTFGTIIACLNNILTNPSPLPVNVLVVTPLKALNRDIFRRILPELAVKLGITIAVRHGDTTQYERQKQTKSPPQILITTPELLQALLPAKIFGREHLKNLQTVIIDEIHDLVESKRGVQLSLALERLTHRIGRNIQRIGLSATIGSPKRVLEFLAPQNKNAKIINIPRLKRLDLRLDYPRELSDQYNNLPSTIHTTEEAASRFQRLIEIIQNEKGTVLLFTNTRQQAEILGYRFKMYNEFVPEKEQISYDVHHSSLSTQTRVRAENDVREGVLDLIIATSSLELGIDIGSVNLVIQYMSPRRIESLIQRVGRAGHGLDKESKGVIITETPRELIEAYLIKTKVDEELVEPTRIHSYAYDILFHSIIGILLDFGETSIDTIYRIITKSAPFQNLTPDELKQVLEFGHKNFFLSIVKDPDTGKISVWNKRKSYKYYYSNLSSIPSKRTYSVVDVGSQTRVGSLDEGFIVTRGEKGAIFILNGTPWELLAINDDKVDVRQVKGITEASIPTWEGELIPVSQLVTSSLQKLFEEKNDFQDAPPEVQVELNKFIRDQKEKGLIPKENTLIIETTGRQMVIHSLLGSRGNETLGLFLATLIGARQGYSVQYRTDPYSIFISLSRPINIVEILKTVEPNHIEPLLEHRIKGTDLFAWKIRQVAKRFGVLSESAENSVMMTRLIKARYKDTIVGQEAINEILSEKMDHNIVKLFLQKIREGKIKINHVQVDNFDSPLSTAATEPISSNVLKLRPSSIILEKIEKRIRNTWVRLVCMRLGCKYEKLQRIESITDIQCPICLSRFIAVVHKNKTGIKALLKKSTNKKVKLTTVEKKELRTAKKSADIILSFGKRAAFVLAGRGIGPTTAIRILREPHKNTEDLLTSIYHHEANFARTREYWE